jgi:hypothetical protein
MFITFNHRQPAQFNMSLIRHFEFRRLELKKMKLKYCTEEIVELN